MTEYTVDTIQMIELERKAVIITQQSIWSCQRSAKNQQGREHLKQESYRKCQGAAGQKLIYITDWISSKYPFNRDMLMNTKQKYKKSLPVLYRLSVLCEAFHSRLQIKSFYN